MDINLNEANTKSELVSGIKELIAQEVEELKKRILSIPVEKRSYFDIIKNWWSNLVHGHDNPKNPYIHRNRLGALGLKEYNLNKKDELKFILETVELLAEEQASQTKFEIILDKWGNKLKEKLNKFIQGCFSGNCEVQPPAEKTDSFSDSDKDITTNTTTTTPIPEKQKTTAVERDFSIFDNTLNDQQKALVADDFTPFLQLSKEEKEKILKIGNFGTQKIRAENKNIIPSLGIEIPYFITQFVDKKPNPLWEIINKYRQDSLSLQNEGRIQTRLVSYRNSLMSILKNKLKTEGAKQEYKEFIDSALNILETPGLKIDPSLWDSLLENQDKIKKFDKDVLKAMTENLKEKDWGDIIQIINDNKEYNFEESNKDSFFIKKIFEYSNKENRLNFTVSETLYERLLTCLEKLRSH